MAYNTVPFHGKVTRVEKNDVAMDYEGGWNIDISLELAAALRKGQHWKEWVPGMGEWGGNFTILLVLGNTEQKAFADNIIAATPGTKLTDVKFLLDGATNAITGDIFITSFPISSPIGDNVKVTVAFKGNGAPSLTDAA